MKVDKAVCTNDTLEDLSRAIKFETVFSTLVENKILAIKRECEEKKKSKRSRSIGRILFGKRIFGADRKSIDDTIICENDVEKGKINESVDIMCHGQLSLGVKNDLETTKIANKTTELFEGKTKTVISNGCEIDTLDDSGPRTSGTSSGVKVIEKEIDTVSYRSASDTSDSPRQLSVHVHEPSVVRAVIEVDRSDIVSIRSDMCRTGKFNDQDKVSGEKRSQSDDNIVRSKPPKKPARTRFQDVVELANDYDNSHSSSDVAMRPSRSNNDKTTRPKQFNAREASLLLEQERCRLRVLEAKSISAQCSPILPRQRHDHYQTDTQASYSDETRHSLHSAPPMAIDHCEIVTFNINEIEKERHNRKSSSQQITSSKPEKKSKHTKSPRDFPRLDYESIVTYQANPLAQGFISSFNQLTTNLPVITTTKTKNSTCDTIKLQRLTSTSTGSTVTNTGCCTLKQKESGSGSRQKQQQQQKDKTYITDLTMASTSEDEFKNRKKLHKKAHKPSDPILVYPSSSGLQHCILSRPPNQPIEFHYDEDFVYDVSLQIEQDRNGDLEAIVPGRRRHRHRHHRHGKKKRHKRRKILVHDLDDQSVKVIDPDDLPQRARWTIIATACLLLIMCLLLVGVTLRMAPIIDDMVRQENERLMQESLNRAKFAKNFTDAAPLAAQEEIP